MGVSFLLDENMEPRVQNRLQAYGYDVEYVADVQELGQSATDDEIAAYSKRENRVILTWDDDFVTDLTESDVYCVIYYGDTTLSREKVADIAHAMADAYPSSAFDGIQYGTRDWL